MKKRERFEKKKKYFNRLIEIDGSVNFDRKMDLIAVLINLAENKINHFDNLRQKNIIFALSSFAVLFNYSLFPAQNAATKIGASLILILLMGIFWLLDYRFNRYSEGWQFTRLNLIEVYQYVLHNPKESVKFERYHKSSEKAVNPFTGLKAMLHFILFLGSIVTLVLALCAQISSN